MRIIEDTLVSLFSWHWNEHVFHLSHPVDVSLFGIILPAINDRYDNEWMTCLGVSIRRKEAVTQGTPFFLKKKKNTNSFSPAARGGPRARAHWLFFPICVMMIGSVTPCFRIGSPLYRCCRMKRWGCHRVRHLASSPREAFSVCGPVKCRGWLVAEPSAW
jgi:hypothetical protein